MHGRNDVLQHFFVFLFHFEKTLLHALHTAEKLQRNNQQNNCCAGQKLNEQRHNITPFLETYGAATSSVGSEDLSSMMLQRINQRRLNSSTPCSRTISFASLTPLVLTAT